MNDNVHGTSGHGTNDHEVLKPEILGAETSFNHSIENGPVAYEPMAGLALALAIASWIIPLLPAFGALAIAPGAKRRIRHSNGMLGGKGLATTAQVIACVNILAWATAIYVVVAVLHWVLG